MAFPLLLAVPLLKSVIMTGVTYSTATEIGLLCFLGGVLSKYGYDWYHTPKKNLSTLNESITPFQKIAESFENQLLNIDESIVGLTKLVEQAENYLAQADKDENEIDKIKLKINLLLESLSKSLKEIQNSFELLCQVGLEQKTFQQSVIEKTNRLKKMQASEQALLLKFKAANEENQTLRGVIKEQNLNLISLFKINQSLLSQSPTMVMTK